MSIIDEVEKAGIVAVIRSVPVEDSLKIADSLIASGIHILEITMENPYAPEIIKHIKKEFTDSVYVGAGTVLDSETARLALMSGAQFIFSPNVDVETITLTKRYGALCVPGALTPTEIIKAYESGADAVKIFPIKAFGSGYLKDLQGPLPHIPFIPTGGIGINHIAEYLSAGAIAVGLGSALVDTKNMHEVNFYANLKVRATKAVEQVKLVKEGNKHL